MPNTPLHSVLGQLYGINSQQAEGLGLSPCRLGRLEKGSRQGLNVYTKKPEAVSPAGLVFFQTRRIPGKLPWGDGRQNKLKVSSQRRGVLGPFSALRCLVQRVNSVPQ